MPERFRRLSPLALAQARGAYDPEMDEQKQLEQSYNALEDEGLLARVRQKDLPPAYPAPGQEYDPVRSLVNELRREGVVDDLPIGEGSIPELSRRLVAAREKKKVQPGSMGEKLAETGMDVTPEAPPKPPRQVAESPAKKDKDVSHAAKKAAKADVKKPQQAAPEASAEEEQAPVMPQVDEEAYSTVKGLDEVQKQALKTRLFARLGAAAELIGTAIARTKPVAQEIYQDIEKDADRMVEEYKAKVEMAKKDPTSDVSKGFRKFAQQVGVKLPENVTAEMGERILPLAYKAYSDKMDKEWEEKKQKEIFAHQKDLKKMDIASEEKIAGERIAASKEEKEIARQEKADLLKEKAEAKDAEGKEKWIDRTAQFINRSQQTKELSKVRRAYNLANKINKGSSVDDIKLLYTLISALDPGSVVREGEIKLAERAKGLWGNLTTKLSQVTSNPRLLSDKVASDIKKTIQELYELSESEYTQMVKPFRARAEKMGLADRWSEIDPNASLSEASSPRSPKSTVAPEASGSVKIRLKGTDQIKLVSPDKAKKYLADPRFEQVQ